MGKKDSFDNLNNLPLKIFPDFLRKRDSTYIEDPFDTPYKNERKDSFLEEIYNKNELDIGDTINIKRKNSYNNRYIRSDSMYFNMHNPFNNSDGKDYYIQDIVYNKSEDEDFCIFSNHNKKENESFANHQKNTKNEEKLKFIIKKDNNNSFQINSKKKKNVEQLNNASSKELNNSSNSINSDKKVNYKLNSQLVLSEEEKIKIKIPKTKRYWHKDNYFLIPNIFKLVASCNEEVYLEHQDYCRKEILVQTNGQKVQDYVSIINKEKTKK